MHPDVVGIGLAGNTLTDLERRILSENTPYGVVLFGRNIESAEQLKSLVAEVKLVSKRPPLIMIDEEGGRVDRLRNLVPGLPSAESFGEGERPDEMSMWLGQVIGMALRYFDIEVNLAPVVDIRSDAAPKGLERRTFGKDPAAVEALAGAFLRGMHSRGTAGCLKHWPGIGMGSADPHYGATVIDISLQQLMERDIVPYRRLGAEAAAIMVGHGTYPQIDDPDLPASLSKKMTNDLLRKIDFDGVAISDDMEMHAVSDLGSYEEIAERALMAGNDVILFCSHVERMPDLQEFITRRVNEDSQVRRRFEDAVARGERYRAHCQRLRELAVPAPGTFEEILEETTRFCDEYERTRPYRESSSPDVDRRRGPRRPPGRTGREEWT